MGSQVRIAACFVLFVACFRMMAVAAQSSAPKAQTSAEILLNAFCRLPNKVFVMECVNEKTKGKALDPWNRCLNSERQLTKDDQINLSCKSLLPQYALINGILTSCVDSLIDPSEAATWMPIMEQCGREAESAGATTTTTASH